MIAPRERLARMKEFQLEAMVARLIEHMRTRDTTQAPVNERPPHY